jgi:hypothetical protein
MTTTAALRSILVYPLLLLTVALPVSASPTLAECALSRINISAGMLRGDLERKIAEVLGKPSTYSAYANNLPGGVVEYRAGSCVLKVTYRAGAPAPMVSTATGQVEHLSPKDESVLSHQVYLVPVPATPARSSGVK